MNRSLAFNHRETIATTTAAFTLLAILTTNAGTFLPFNEARAQTDSNSTSEQSRMNADILIPRGSANPEIDLTLQKIGNWYDPKKITISAGDKVTWKNEDSEGHTVTSGLGAGIQSVQTNEKGKSDGIFDSGPFKPGGTWSHTFYNPGTYNYFCTIHPWMEGVVVVNPLPRSEIPSYPVDSMGKEQQVWPVHTFSSDGKYDIDLKWDPLPVLTGETVTFIADFYDMPSNTHTQPTAYDFVVMQNGKELDRLYALTEVGVGVHKYQFSKAGPITVRIENIAGDQKTFTEFNTVVYPNPSNGPTDAAVTSGEEATRISGGTEPVSRLINPLTLVWFTYGVIFSLPAALAAFIILFKKGKI